MGTCRICGVETAKDRVTCKGCDAVKKVAKRKDKTPNYVFKTATDHIEKNPGLLNISWKSFWKKNTKIYV